MERIKGKKGHRAVKRNKNGQIKKNVSWGMHLKRKGAVRKRRVTKAIKGIVKTGASIICPALGYLIAARNTYKNVKTILKKGKK
ncbi:MAG: hypothetical protein BWK75_02620 [Candidatus Altiarchaeales archaeon A3]|nr:MAG: hypothetical protein BWK75_02620 [Candidatus Altiarchaeales archaeon A3]